MADPRVRFQLQDCQNYAVNNLVFSDTKAQYLDCFKILTNSSIRDFFRSYFCPFVRTHVSPSQLSLIWEPPRTRMNKFVYTTALVTCVGQGHWWKHIYIERQHGHNASQTYSHKTLRNALGWGGPERGLGNTKVWPVCLGIKEKGALLKVLGPHVTGDSRVSTSF